MGTLLHGKARVYKRRDTWGASVRRTFIEKEVPWHSAGLGNTWTLRSPLRVRRKTMV